MQGNSGLVSLLESFWPKNKAKGLLAQTVFHSVINKGLFGADGAEKILYERFLASRPQVERACQNGDFDAAFALLANLRSAIDAYFAEIMVMAEDPMIRINRLSFLSQMSQTLNLIADFTKLVKK